ncbi:putative inorganic phosphate cotransporter [Pieris rapae]|uniref:putative inorganic phosphate cotransporter n=1 Tax=Pieris rapae TaxID=64459 RepID=UPI001E2812E2|nr:putative inorganic phosphate cotransporter [Pieris rapae]
MEKNDNNEKTDLEVRKMEISVTKEFKVAGWGYRHQQCVILFLTLTVAYSMRSCMGVALVAMTDVQESQVHVDIINGTITNSTDSNEESNLLHSWLLVPPYPRFKWPKKTQDAVLSSFFWGYMLTQIPAGQIAHFFGAKYMLFGALLINCFVSFCFPWAAFYGGWIVTALCRFLQGLSQACIMPGLHTFLGKWAPLEERGRLAGFAFGGQAIGTVLGLPITGFIASSSLGWPGIFRFYGVISGIVAIFIWWLAADSPGKHPKISFEERTYIEEALSQRPEDKKKVRAVPWKNILTCRGMYAIIIAHIGSAWGQLTLYSEVPAFMDKVMGVNIKANGLLTALPFLCMWFANFFFSWLTDMLIVKKILNVTHTRKFANSLGSIPAAIGLITLAYVPKNIYVVETLLIFICCFKSAASLGYHVNHIDISSNYAGTMMSLSNFGSNLVGSLAPLVAGYILTDVTDELLWRKIFFVAAGFYLFTNLFYVILGTGEKADWNDPPSEKDTENPQETVAMLNSNGKEEKKLSS